MFLARDLRHRRPVAIKVLHADLARSLGTERFLREIETAAGLMNFVMLPMWLVSGVFFASSNFPDVAQPVIQALPLTALIDALRDVTNDGESLAAVAPDLGILAGWGAVSFAAALKLFRWS